MVIASKGQVRQLKEPGARSQVKVARKQLLRICERRKEEECQAFMLE
jgi:hypothetical protein